MALYCLKSRPLQRSKGHSATGLGCYMLDMSAIDPYTEKEYKQDDRHEHAMTVISFFPGDEDHFSSPIEVFQAIDAFEKRKDASLVNGGLKLTQFSPWQRFKTDTPQILTCTA